MAESKTGFKVDKTWVIDKVIELSIFVLGFVIALWLDGKRGDVEAKKLKEHYIEIVQNDLLKDQRDYRNAIEHDSIRSEGCDFILTWLIKRQNSDIHSYGMLRHNSQSRIGPGFDFERGRQFNAKDTIQIISEKSGWFQDTSGYWINKQIVRQLDKDFNWFSAEVNDSVVNVINEYGFFLDQTKSVFMHRTGYDGLISQNTSAFLKTTDVESRLSDYYNYGEYVHWIEDYYRDTHFGQYSYLRNTFGQTDIFRFLYLLNNEQNIELIRHLTLASQQCQKEIGYYKKVLQMNREICDLLDPKKE